MMATRTIRREPDEWPIEHVRVVDGDSLEAYVLLPFRQSFKAKLRLKGWWADELEGPYALQGMLAKSKLEQWAKDKALSIRGAGGGHDVHGRIIAHLVHHNQLVNPKDVLGELQLTEKEHKRRRDLIGKRATGPQDDADRAGCDGTTYFR